MRHVRDELTGGDPILVTALAVAGGGIRLSRRALLQEQCEKLNGAIAVL